MILDSDSIETLPSDATISPGEAADDDVIFDRPPDNEPNSTLPGILEECEESAEETTELNVLPETEATESIAFSGVQLETEIPVPPVLSSEIQIEPELVLSDTSSPIGESFPEPDLNQPYASGSKEDIVPPPSPPIGSDSSAFATYKSAKEPDPIKPAIRRQSSSEEKRGVFSKILEFVGVVKKKEDVETSVFYDDPLPVQVEEKEESKGVEGIHEILKATDLSTIQDEKQEMKKRSPSPRIAIAAVPATNVIAATPPTSPDQKPPRRDPDALTVDNTIPETPPVTVVEKKTPIFVEPVIELNRDCLMKDIDGIIEEAIMIAEDQLSEAPAFLDTTIEAPKPPIAVMEEFEEIRVTSDEDRKRTVEKPTSSKLAEQILKAIPPPRRRAITDAKNPTGLSVSVQVEKPIDVVTEQPPPVPPRRRNRSKQRVEFKEK